ncbi:site-specific integrase [Propionivibrio sp.]|uniref:site-specific integrase n=1 Tax=Propionivibrio sp. TaxID=2212460 RepID=UPI003BEF79F0
MATVRLQKNGGWQAIVRRKGHPQQSKTFSLQYDAEVWARDVETRIDKGLFVSTSEAERMTFDDLLKRFREEFAPHHYRHDDKTATWRYQCARLSKFFGRYSLIALDQNLLVRFRDERLKPPKSGEKAVGESTVRKELYMLSKILGFAEKECGITLPRGNVVDKIRKPSESKPRERRLSPDEWAAFSSECQKSRNIWLWPAVRIAVATAMRQGELLKLMWSDVDIKNRFALLRETKNGEVRATPLSSDAIAVLAALPRSVKGRVFPCARLTLYRAFERACARAEITDFTWHDLRHEALSRLAERGDFTVLELAAVSGHKTLQMLKRYTHLQATKLAEKMG